MLEIKFIRKNLSLVKDSLKKRGDDTTILKNFEENDSLRKRLIPEIEELRNKRNTVSQEIALKKKNKEDASDLISEMKKNSDKIKEIEKELKDAEEKISELIVKIPNIPHISVPEGKDDSENVFLRKEGNLPEFNFKPKAHWDLGDELKIFNFEKSAEITGARFPLYMGAGAKLERALINFMLDVHTSEHNYTEVLPPFIVNRNSMTGTGQLPKFEEDLFKLDNMDYFLIPTAEVPLTNIFKNEILQEEDLPVYFTAFTPCFRKEAGSYGKDTRGLIRQHQFNKVELVKFVKPEDSYEELEKLLSDAEKILKLLELPYQIVTLCSGDLGFSSAKTYDIEVWMPAQKKYREISSCSNFEDFQSRRANIRFKKKNEKGTFFPHTLNGSGLAAGRTVAAILENNQREDGTILIPKALRPYMNNQEIIKSEK
ncbi:MAG: serine--tRNA ligase [Deltaproteobacteria bacterium]|nr:MAG: serine--tRNA ligase [Deltaproteobacteria bacterium]